MMAVITNNWTFRKTERGLNRFHLSRWSYLVMQGKEGNMITLITAYHVCSQTPSLSGQQFCK